MHMMMYVSIYLGINIEICPLEVWLIIKLDLVLALLLYNPLTIISCNCTCAKSDMYAQNVNFYPNVMGQCDLILIV